MDIAAINASSASASPKDQNKKRTTTTTSSRRLRRRSFKRTRRSTPESDENSDSDNNDFNIEDNKEEAENLDDHDDKEAEENFQLKAEDTAAEEVESLVLQEEIEEVDYETQRKRNILENQRLLQELGLNKSIVRKTFPPITKSKNDDYEDNDDISSDGEYNDEIGSKEPKKGRRFSQNKASWRKATAPVATRASKRIRGEAAAEAKVDLEALERSLNGRAGNNEDEGGDSRSRGEGAAPPFKLGEYSRSLWKGRKQTTGFTVEVEIPSATVPLTVGSIATTIWELGSIYKGEKNKLKYWSGGGSLFKHPYPIGYRAEKFYFRERYMMHIKEGPDGPIFIVESASGRVFEGTSPTLPWTKVCLASSSKGTRISGPLFFGFSDPITQKMIEGLEGYQAFEQVKAEVQAAEEQEEQRRLQADATEE
ncbi:hypothetical protein K457DRAFT_101444 [Linnemannia elongata AG-77]|uniref:Uncharacterized protein n=1 Tax=Linnemannia elongata AG-77 TaxID=1314771 RepID=A0A197JF94_9FUNG|nr:hypothetical protein K457DRAFT_101444 [Linnemannia elongata AG-77]